MNHALLQQVLSRPPGDPAARYTDAQLLRRTLSRPDARASIVAGLNEHACVCCPPDSPRRRTCERHTAGADDVARVIHLAVAMLDEDGSCQVQHALHCAVVAQASAVREREALASDLH